MVDELQTFVGQSLVHVLEDSNGVTLGVLHSSVAVGDVDVGRGELGRGWWDQDFTSSPESTCGWVGRDDGDRGISRDGAVWWWWDVLD